MKIWFLTAQMLLAGGLIFPSLLMAGESGDSPVRLLEGLVGRWVDLRGQIDGEERSWAAQSEQWRQETALLCVEQEKLTAALATLEEAGETRQERSADLLARRDQLRSTLEQVDGVLRRIQPRLAALQSLVPPSLLTVELASALRPEPVKEGDSSDVVARLQRMLGALQALDSFQSGIHSTRALIALPTGTRREMDVIFFGLARGFAVTADDRTAAAGYPTADGWLWKALPESAPAVRRLLQIAKQEEPPVLVPFPVAGGADVGSVDAGASSGAAVQGGRAAEAP